jgi:hypothetical protein
MTRSSVLIVEGNAFLKTISLVDASAAALEDDRKKLS